MPELISLMETREHRGYTIEIHRDACTPESPRDWCNLGTIIAWHKNFQFSDEDAPDCASPQDFEEWAQEEEIPFCFPLFMFEHGPIALSLANFDDPWDSGQVGYVYVTNQRISESYDEHLGIGGKPTEEQIYKIMQAEVETLAAYANGEVYGYTVTDPEGLEIDSCWGFIGESGRWDHLTGEARDFVNRHIASKPGRWRRLVWWWQIPRQPG